MVKIHLYVNEGFFDNVYKSTNRWEEENTLGNLGRFLIEKKDVYISTPWFLGGCNKFRQQHRIKSIHLS